MRSLSRRGVLPLVLSCAASTAPGCESIKQDKFMDQGGISPDPSALLEGSVLYIGPHPTCVFNPDGSAARVLGKVAMTLFVYDNPPPPQGEASTAVNLMFVSGDELFTTSDCLPQGAFPNYVDRITRSVPFVWSGVALSQTDAVDYQIRAFYDYDEDMNPLFSVTRTPTEGDIIGGAVNDIQDASKGFLEISLPKQSDAPNGIVHSGLTVALGQPVWTARPAFALDDNRTLAATTPFTPGIVFAPDGSIVPNGVASLRSFRALTCRTGGFDGTTCGLTLQRLSADLAPTLDALKVEVVSSSNYAFFAEPVDIETVVIKPPGDTTSTGGLDQPVPDGKVDPHPLLGASLGVPWYSPVVIMQRLPDPQAATIEQQARIPQVLLVASVLLDDDSKPIKQSYVQTGVPIAVPPVAAVELIPGHPECRVPYFAPGTLAAVTDGRLANCDELPTGHYSVNVFDGIAGGMPGLSSGFPTSSESPVEVTGGGASGQSWSVPNELGDPHQVGTQTAIASQSLANSFVVHDPSADKAACVTSSVQGLCVGGPEIIESVSGVDSALCLLPDCCTYVSHLCAVPTCEKVATADGNIAASPSKIVGTGQNGAPVPDCVPFELPWQCCRPSP